MKNVKKIVFVCALIALVTVSASPAFARSVVWAGDFQQSQSPTFEQCQDWQDFLDQLSPDNQFTSVTIRGSYAPEGITMTDPAAIQELAYLLYSRTSGSVSSEGHTWYVYIGCNLESCVSQGQGVELRVDQGGGCKCLNSGSYTVRPDIGNPNWGGINTPSCFSESQTMMVTFETTSDSDNDGIADDEDLCPMSDLSQTVIVEDCYSDVYNSLFSDGCTVNDLINNCADTATNHGRFVSCVSHQLNSLKKEGLLSRSEKGVIQRCVAK